MIDLGRQQSLPVSVVIVINLATRLPLSFRTTAGLGLTKPLENDGNLVMSLGVDVPNSCMMLARRLCDREVLHMTPTITRQGDDQFVSRPEHGYPTGLPSSHTKAAVFSPRPTCIYVGNKQSGSESPRPEASRQAYLPGLGTVL
jgi:hypothetical protein